MDAVMASLRPRTNAPHRTVRNVARGLSVLVAVTMLPAVADAQPLDRMQTVGSLQERARRIAAELEALDQKTNHLDEELNNAQIELDGLRAGLVENQQQVDAAQAQLDAHQNDAQEFAVRAFVGSGNSGELPGIDGDVLESSRRRTFLEARYGASEDAVDDLVVAQEDLSVRKAELKRANDVIDAKVADLDKARRDLEATIADREALQQTVQGELAAALEAEQQRQAREAAAKAQAEAEAAAARAAAARRPQAAAVAVPLARSNSVSSPATPPPTVAAPPRSITPATPGAPTAVQVALEQQGDPYRWAGSGPTSFDCSGLVMFAYAAAGRSLPHSSRALRSMTQRLSVDELQPGDLVFGGSPVHHVGIYIGNGQMVHAPNSGEVVKVESMYSTSKPVSFGRL